MNEKLSHNDVMGLILASANETDLQLDEISFDKRGVMWRYIDDSGGGSLPIDYFRHSSERFRFEVRRIMEHYTRHLKQG